MNIADTYYKDRSIYYMNQHINCNRLHWNCINKVDGLLDALSEKFCHGEKVNDMAFGSDFIYIYCEDEGAWHSAPIREYVEFVVTYGE